MQLQLFCRIIWRSILDKSPINPPQQPEVSPVPQPQPIEGTQSGLKTPGSGKWKKILLWASGAVVALLVLLSLGAYLWYQQQLSPVDASSTELVRVDIVAGTTPDGIARQLEEEGLIRSVAAFSVYTRVTGVQNSLQAGTYRLSPSESTPEIVGHLQNGKVDSFDITFLPGATLADNRQVLLAAGYPAEEVDAALAVNYQSPLFEGKPTGADLEGYIFGETYRMASGAAVTDILLRTFDEFEAVIDEYDLVAGYEAQGLSLFEGITLASIIQRESGGGDQAEIAQIFLKRLEIGMELGSDVTYQYIADKTGVERSVDLDSPYNTRRYAGLPPGPIAVPGVDALRAVAAPADTDYLSFWSGDDDVTYYGRTLEEHEANIRNYCQQKCQII